MAWFYILSSNGYSRSATHICIVIAETPNQETPTGSRGSGMEYEDTSIKEKKINECLYDLVVSCGRFIIIIIVHLRRRRSNKLPSVPGLARRRENNRKSTYYYHHTVATTVLYRFVRRIGCTPRK